ncbi:P-loop containing nucleoside triphosphate hydrolase protein [Cladochytrium replicatum]|nr:P-loop containing nucleoside triphosphate hydrolase protein [Cladochytrium replicatum]
MTRLSALAITLLSFFAVAQLIGQRQNGPGMSRISAWLKIPGIKRSLILAALLFALKSFSSRLQSTSGPPTFTTRRESDGAIGGDKAAVSQTSAVASTTHVGPAAEGELVKPRMPSFFRRIIWEFTGIDFDEMSNGGMSIFWVAGAIWFMRNYANQISDFFYRSVTVNVIFDSQDDTFRWMMTYLLERELAKHSTSIAASTRQLAYPGDSNWAMQDEPDEPKAFYLPGEGTTYFTYKNNLMWFHRHDVGVSAEAMYLRGQRSSNILTIGKLGRSKNVLYEMVDEARKLSLEKDHMKTIVFMADVHYWGVFWKRSRARGTRKLSTVVLEKGLAESIVEDIREFLKSQKWYVDRGIPYRRGYMFYGPPGTGKSSLVTALAGELNMHIFVLSLSNNELTDDGLQQLMVSTLPKCILLIEDVDAAFLSRTSTSQAEDDKQKSKVTFSGLLNALDGAAAQEGRIVIMTTNHLEKLDPALVRPGRVDRMTLFHLATKWQARELFLQFFPDGGKFHETLADEFATEVPEEKVSMAAIQGYLMQYKSSPKDAAAGAAKWILEELERQAEEERKKEEKRKEKEEKEKKEKEKKDNEEKEKRQKEEREKEEREKNEKRERERAEREKVEDQVREAKEKEEKEANEKEEKAKLVNGNCKPVEKMTFAATKDVDEQESGEEKNDPGETEKEA